ncbi:MAG: hypothetical protein B7Z66_03770 [Chromatiales bacterium 21-64-14]|nr:MAG: hypothetical protein B7Z66_03770 [Chromatiales bacterium 21-64-14]HQU14803.1 CDP-alcohol phosphatidyltransferase family protein [Gammaproteobacteria bacterium]
MKGRDLPNLITLSRILLVAPMGVLLFRQWDRAALTLFALAGLSDALDGALAKRYGWTSRIGALLDPLADKLLLVCAYGVLGWLEVVPRWLVALVVARDLTIVAGAVAYHFRFGPFDPAPSPVSKWNTTAQIVLVLAVLFDRGVYPLAGGWIETFMAMVLVTTVASWADYLWVWGRRGWQEARR